MNFGSQIFILVAVVIIIGMVYYSNNKDKIDAQNDQSNSMNLSMLSLYDGIPSDKGIERKPENDVDEKRKKIEDNINLIQRRDVVYLRRAKNGHNKTLDPRGDVMTHVGDGDGFNIQTLDVHRNAKNLGTRLFS